MHMRLYGTCPNAQIYQGSSFWPEHSGFVCFIVVSHLYETINSNRFQTETGFV